LNFQLQKFEDDFKAFARELRAFREKIKSTLQAAQKTAAKEENP
jgi:hypothetical protein